MAQRRTIRRKYGKLLVYEQSIVFLNHCMFLRKDPETIPDLIPKLDAMLEDAYEAGAEDARQKISQKYADFIGVLSL